MLAPGGTGSYFSDPADPLRCPMAGAACMVAPASLPSRRTPSARQGSLKKAASNTRTRPGPHSGPPPPTAASPSRQSRKFVGLSEMTSPITTMAATQIEARAKMTKNNLMPIPDKPTLAMRPLRGPHTPLGA